MEEKKVEKLYIENIKLSELKETAGKSIGRNKEYKNFFEKNKESFKIALKELSEITDAQIILDFKVIDFFSQLQLLIPKIDNAELSSFLEIQIKCFSLILKELQEDIEELPLDLSEFISVIDKNFDEIPSELNKINLPRNEFLPPSSQTGASQEKWSTKISTGEKIGFFEQKIKVDEGGEKKTKSVASTRLELFSNDINLKNTQEALCYAECDFYELGNLHADHLQPASNIRVRQLEMIYAMNVNSKFCHKMLDKAKLLGKQNDKIKYFIIKDEEIFGTELFFKEYFNCMDNLWLITAAKNSGSGKGDKDPIEWIKSNKRYGEKCLNDLGEVNKKPILYTVNTKDNGELILCESVKNWFKEKYLYECNMANIKLNLTKTYKIKMEEINLIDTTNTTDKKDENKKNKKKLVLAFKILIASDTLERTYSSDEDKSTSQSYENKIDFEDAKRIVKKRKNEKKEEVKGFVKEYQENQKLKKEDGEKKDDAPSFKKVG